MTEDPEKKVHSDSFSHGSGPDLEPFSDPILLEEPERRRFRWAVPWSDLMMTMFVMFAVLYIYQAGHREFEFRPETRTMHTSSQGDRKTEKVSPEKFPSEVFDRTLNAIEEEFVSNFSEVEFAEDKAIRISMAADLLFDPGRAELKNAAKYQLRQIADILKQNSLAVNVAGHTDITPIHSERYPTNWELSAVRAVNVARFMMETCGVSSNRFFLTAHSYHQPVRPNDTLRNRALNRRVEIILMKEKPGAGLTDYHRLKLPDKIQ